jgi:hypothetical protein
VTLVATAVIIIAVAVAVTDRLTGTARQRAEVAEPVSAVAD